MLLNLLTVRWNDDVEIARQFFGLRLVDAFANLVVLNLQSECLLWFSVVKFFGVSKLSNNFQKIFIHTCKILFCIMLKWKYNYFLIIPIILTAIALIISIQSATAYENYISDKTLSPIAEVDTRNSFLLLGC